MELIKELTKEDFLEKLKKASDNAIFDIVTDAEGGVVCYTLVSTTKEQLISWLEDSK